MADRQLTFGIRLKADGSGFVGEVRLAGDEVQKFGQATKQAAQEAAAGTAQVTQSAVAMGATMGTVLGQAIVKAAEFGVQFARAIADSIEAMGNLAITSERLQTSVETLTRLDYVARLNNVSNQALARSFRELNKDVFEAARGNELAAQQFRAVGIEIRDGSGKIKDAQTLFLQLADVVASIEDPVIKAAVATRFFGARAEELLPVLNKGSDGIRDLYGEAERFGAVVSGTAAKAANDLNDSVTRLQISGEAWRRAVASDWVPTLLRMADAMLEARTRGLSFAESVSSAFTAASTPTDQLAEQVRTLRTELIALEAEAQRNKVSFGGLFGGAINAGASIADYIKTAGRRSQFEALDAALAPQRQRQIQQALGGVAGTFGRLDARDLAGTFRSSAERPPSAEEILAGLNRPQRSGRAASERDRGADLESNIAQQIELLNREDEAGRRLTQSEQLRVKIEQELADGKLTLTTRQMIAIDAGLEEWRVQELNKRAKEEAARAEEKLAQERERAVEAAQQQTDQLQKQLDTFGMTRAQILGYEEAQLRAKLAIQQASGAAEADIEVTRRLLAEKRDQRDIEEDLAHLRAGQQLDDMLRDIEDETRLLGLSNAERQKAILLRKLEREGIVLTAEELDKLNRIGAAIDLNDQARRVQQAIDDAAGAAARFGEELVLNFSHAGDAVKQLEQDLLRIGTRLLVTQPLEDFFKDFLGSIMKGKNIGGAGGGFFDTLGDLFISVFGLHGGGIAGSAAEASFTRRVPRALFANAPRMHSGGLVAGEVPAILKAGEEVVTTSDPRHRANGGGGRTVINNYNTFAVPAGTSRATASQIGAGFARQLDQLQRRAVTP